MQTKIIKIGNSKGLRLSKTILEKYNISESVNLVLKEGYIELHPCDNPREGWVELLEEMHENQDDQLLIQDVFDDEQFEEWK